MDSEQSKVINGICIAALAVLGAVSVATGNIAVVVFSTFFLGLFLAGASK